MKLIALLLIPILLCTGCKESKPDYEKIDSPHAIPLLATDFGKIIEIEGQVLDGNDTGKKADSGQTMISINTVAGRKLDAPIVMPLSVFPTPLSSYQNLEQTLDSEVMKLADIPAFLKKPLKTSPAWPPPLITLNTTSK